MIPRRNLIVSASLFLLGVVACVATHAYSALILWAVLVPAYGLYVYYEARGGRKRD